MVLEFDNTVFSYYTICIEIYICRLVRTLVFQIRMGLDFLLIFGPSFCRSRIKSSMNSNNISVTFKYSDEYSEQEYSD